MAWQLRPLPWGAFRGHTGLQSRLVDGIQYCCVPLVLQECARRVESEPGLVECIYVSEAVLVGELLNYLCACRVAVPLVMWGLAVFAMGWQAIACRRVFGILVMLVCATTNASHADGARTR